MATLDELVGRVNDREKEAARDTVLHFKEQGDDLIRIRAELLATVGGRKFWPSVRDKLTIGKATAYVYISVAENWESIRLATRPIATLADAQRVLKELEAKAVEADDEPEDESDPDAPPRSPLMLAIGPDGIKLLIEHAHDPVRGTGRFYNPEDGGPSVFAGEGDGPTEDDDWPDPEATPVDESPSKPTDDVPPTTPPVKPTKTVPTTDVAPPPPPYKTHPVQIPSGEYDEFTYLLGEACNELNPDWDGPTDLPVLREGKTVLALLRRHYGSEANDG